MPMIPDSLPAAQAPEGWQQALTAGFRRVDALLAHCAIDPTQVDADPDSPFPLRVTRHYADLIEKGNPRDPLLLQVLPDTREALEMAGYGEDPVGDRDAEAAPGLIHKYPGRVLLTLTGACAIHCRYCFRRHYPYGASVPDIDGAVFDYLRARPDIHELILSGGDPLMWPNARLAELIEHLGQLPHLRLLRIHSRMPTVLPERIDDGLTALLGRFPGRVTLVIHVNHPRELDRRSATALGRLRQAGVQLLNQSVLLRGINDRAEVLAALSFRLYEQGVLPYYLHRLDRVQGSAHFDLPDAQSCHIHRQLRERLPGYLLPRMVNEIPGTKSKTPAHCG